MSEARSFAGRLVAGPPMALALAKAAVYRGLDSDLNAAFDYASTAEAITLASEDHIEGINAFRQERPLSSRAIADNSWLARSSGMVDPAMVSNASSWSARIG